MLEIFGNNHDANGAVKWQLEPVGRGTWSTLNMSFDNVPVYLDRGASECAPGGNDYTRIPGWLILGLIAPELVVFTAWHQFMDARETVEDLINLKYETSEKTANSTPL